MSDLIHKADVASYFDACHDTFGQLEALLKVIAPALPEYSDPRRLANLGIAVAADYANMADCWREEISIKGVRNAWPRARRA